MRIINGNRFLTVSEVQNFLEDKLKKNFNIYSIRRKGTSLNCFLMIENIMHVPEELIIFFEEDITKKEKRLQIQKELEKKMENFRKIIEEFEKEN